MVCYGACQSRHQEVQYLVWWLSALYVYIRQSLVISRGIILRTEETDHQMGRQVGPGQVDSGGYVALHDRS